MNQSFQSNSRRHPVWPHHSISEIFEENRFEIIVVLVNLVANGKYHSEASRFIRGNAFERDDETLSGISSLSVSLTDTSGFFATPSSLSEARLVPLHSSTTSGNFTGSETSYTSDEYIDFALPSDSQSLDQSSSISGEELMEYENETSDGFE
ncbi:unnamed protein product, partial [Mesorhabditis belari]|uniref:Uncharacterized protein n=1 Tax=Mesorhabditis belari TaxID=2138241 RepID=A0AAF3F9P0_9BILA